MLLKPIKTIATSIHNPRTIESHLQKSVYCSLGICTRQFSRFAKTILDKYTKVLNYQFDYASLVFLEQLSGEKEEGKKEYQNNIYVTWKLLYCILNNESKMDQFLHNNPALLNQIVQKVENNLSEIKKEDKTLYQDMKKYYRMYQKLDTISVEKNNLLEKTLEMENAIQIDKMDSYAAALKYVKQQIVLCEEKQQNGALLKRESNKNMSFIAPFSMSRSFFINLNHLIKENRIPSYKQIWQQSVTKQMERYYLDLHMQQFVKEEDLIKREEMIFQIFQEFGHEEIEKYLEEKNEAVYQKFLQVMYVITQGQNDSEKFIKNVKQLGDKGTTKVFNKNEKLKMYPREHVQMDERSKETEYINKEAYESMQQELLFAEYKNTEKNIMDILHNSEEVTRNVILGKVEEYKEVFYEYIRSTMSSENEEEKQGESIQADNPEVFSNRELQVLLDALEGKNITEEAVFLQKKLNLVAVKEITESYLEENTKLLQKEVLQGIQSALGHISFVSETVKTDVDVLQKEKEALVTTHEELNQIKIIRQKEENKNYFSMEHLEQIFETGSLVERKLLYLALEHTIDKMLIEKNYQEDKQTQKELIQAKQNITKITDMEKRLAGDWRFLMVRQKGEKLVHSISQLRPETRTLLKEIVQKNIEAFYTDLEQKQEIETDQGLMEEWQSFFDQEDRKQLYQMISQGKRESSLKIKKDVLETEKLEKHNQENQLEKKDTAIKNLKISDMIHVIEHGNLPERKLMYLALRNAVSFMEHEEIKNHVNQNRNNENREEKETKRENIKQKTEIYNSKQLLRLKEVVFRDTDNIQIEKGRWEFLNQKERNRHLVESLTAFKKAEKKWLEQSIQWELNAFQKMLYGSQMAEEMNEKERRSILKESGILLQSSITKEEWKALLNSKEFAILGSKKEKLTNNVEESTKTLYNKNVTKNVNKKLNIRQLCDRMVHGNNQKTLLNLHNFENAEEKFYQYSRQLNKNTYLTMLDSAEVVSLLIQTNGSFMLPPMKEQIPKVQNNSSQSVLSDKMKYHEENAKLIFNHRKERIEKEEKEHQRKDAMEQGKVIQKLEENLMDYRVELEDKDSRLEVVEKQLQEQKRKLQLLHENQGTISREKVKPAEARQFMRHLKEEMKIEQMRRGKF